MPPSEADVSEVILENYFNYFTEIEEHFQRRRGRIHLSPLDWALIETWKDAGIPLEAVLRGVDTAFDKYESRPSKSQKVNSLAYCAQAVLVAAEEMKEAAVGAASSDPKTKSDHPSGFQIAEISAFLRNNAQQLESVKLPQAKGISAEALAKETANTLREIAAELDARNASPKLEDLERRLTVAEEKLFAVLLAATPDEQIVAVRAETDRELAPYRRKMPSTQIEQLQRQYVHKRLLEKYGLPRLSLFYM
jgi:hypothetical protein